VKKGEKKVLEVADAITDPIADSAIAAQEKKEIGAPSPIETGLIQVKKRPVWLYAGGGLFTLGLIIFIAKQRKKKNAVNR
jgi:hypothetical protein